jgi:hypothetical protein
MAITSADIKLIESERMTDTSDGGGRRTATVIPDGADIFPKVSRLDAVYGRVNLRKVYGTVDTANVDTYAGAHAIVTDPPDNSRISVCLFSTGSDFDVRSGAQDRVESYVVAGPESRMWLYGQQPVGAKAMLVFQQPEEPLPEVGDVYALTQENTAGTILQTQYVRIDSITHEVRNFEDDKGIYDFRVITLGLTSPLTYAFRGQETPVRNSASNTRLGKVRTTSVADAARYFGVQPLSEPIASGALSLRVPSVYTYIVPTTQRETALSLAEIAGARGYIEAGATFSDVVSGFTGDNYFFPSGVMPNTIVMSNSRAGWPATDDGSGALVFAAYPAGGGAIDYDAGSITSLLTPGADGGVSVAARHAVPAAQPSHTKQIAVTLATRGSLYTATLSPPPAPGTAVVDYRALGKWYRLRDEDGSGTLRGTDPAYGTGTIDYATGGVVVTLGALPDVGSSVLFAWGSATHYTQRVGATVDADTRCRQTIQLADSPVQSNSVVLTLQYGSAPVTVSLNSSNTGANANLQASVDIKSGLVSILYIGNLPDPGSTIGVAYSARNAAVGSPEPVDQTGTAAISFAVSSIDSGKEIAPGTLRMNLPMVGSLQASGGAYVVRAIYEGTVQLVDDGLGALRIADGQFLTVSGASTQTGNPTATLTAGTSIGSINYTTGSISISGSIPLQGKVWQTPLGIRPGAWVDATGTATRYGKLFGLDWMPTDKPATYSFEPADATTTSSSVTESFTWAQAPLRVNIAKSTGDAVVPGSVVFRIGANLGTNVNQYIDRGGVIVRNVDTDTGAATSCGTMNYLSGEATVTDWYAVALGGSVLVQSCLTSRGEFVADEAFFRTAGSPVRTGSLFVQATTEDGLVASGSANVDGDVTGTLIEGTIEQDMGVVSLRFGEWKPVAGNETEPWYDPALIDPSDSTRVWKPTRVFPSTIRYSCIVTSNVALDTAILGLDPVRLPLDGRVPIFRPGDVAVIHNTQSIVLTNPVSAGATYSVGRTNLSDLWLVSAGNIRVDPSKYTVDLAAGTVTMAAPLDLTGVAQPLTAKHRVEDMVLLSDVRIDGTLETAGAVTRSYATSGTYVSSALLFGDMAARVANVFDQATWLGTWADSLTGDGATAQYNDVLYPIEVLNSGAITERWRIAFTSTTSFQVIGENSGVIATGNTSTDCGPVNPLTLEPYFVIRAGGWGSGWSVGNQLRFNTRSAASPIWMARTILPGAALTGDSIDVQLRGDVDA